MPKQSESGARLASGDRCSRSLPRAPTVHRTVGPRRFEPPTDAVVVPPRAYDCDRYEECLLVAARKVWRSWSCRDCARCPDDARLEVWKSSQPPSRAVLRRR